MSGAIRVILLLNLYPPSTIGSNSSVGASSTVIAATMTGAAIGGVVAGGMEMGTQISQKGIEGMDINAVAIESFTGSVHGAINGAMGTTTSAPARLAMRGGLAALGGVNAVAHGINNGETGKEIAKSAGISVATGLMLQTFFAGMDARTGKFSSRMLEAYSLDGARSFGAKQILTLSGILTAKNAWRNRQIWCAN